MPDNRPAVYVENDRVIYRASALGHPLCQLWAARSGLTALPFPQAIQDAMDEGTRLEVPILEKLHDEHHWGFAYGAQFQVELFCGAWNGKSLVVRGHVDEVRDDGIPVDIKAFSQSLVDNVPAHYQWQQSVYANAFPDGRYYMPIYNKDTEKIVPWSLGAYYPKYTRENIRDRVLQVEEAYYNNQMPDCPSEYGCPYFFLHEKKQADALPETAQALAKARIILSERIKQLEIARRRLDELITPRLTQDTSYVIDDYSVILLAKAARFNTDYAKELLTMAEIDWQEDSDFWIQGEGTTLRMTPKKVRKRAEVA